MYKNIAHGFINNVQTIQINEASFNKLVKYTHYIYITTNVYYTY